MQTTFQTSKFFMLVGLIAFAVWLIPQPYYDNCHCKLGRQTAAVQTLRTIHNSQTEYHLIHKRFGTLKQLAEAGLLEEKYANGQPVHEYIFSWADISAETDCVQATRSTRRKAYKDFIVCEDGIIRYWESDTPQRLNRGEGNSISELEADPSPTPTP
jgi:hypothetical protein